MRRSEGFFENPTLQWIAVGSLYTEHCQCLFPPPRHRGQRSISSLKKSRTSLGAQISIQRETSDGNSRLFITPISETFAHPHLALSVYCGHPPKICGQKDYASVRPLRHHLSTRGFVSVSKSPHRNHIVLRVRGTPLTTVRTSDSSCVEPQSGSRKAGNLFFCSAYCAKTTVSMVCITFCEGKRVGVGWIGELINVVAGTAYRGYRR